MGAPLPASVTVPVMDPGLGVRLKFCVVLAPAVIVTLALWLA